MKRLLFVLCSLFAVQEVCARRPAVRFDLPYTVEHGKYVVVLGTPAGPRRFIFDTGASGTCISESLRDELGAEIVKTQKVRDFEGHVVPIDLVRLDSLRMGDALFRDHPVLVMPDTSLVFACLRVDGIAGCDLLRWCAVRMPNADSTITVTDDVRTLGLPRGRRMSRMELGGGCPFLPVTCRNGDRQARMYVKFDTGSAGYFHFSYADSGDAPPPLWFIDSLRWADGYASAIGWTNRNRVNSHFRGTIPRFEIQGTAIADMPVKRTFGHNRILGCKLFDWGRSCSISAASASCSYPAGARRKPRRSPPVILRWPFPPGSSSSGRCGTRRSRTSSPPATASSRSTGTPGTATSADSCSTPTRWTVRCAGSGRPPGSMLS